MPEGTNLPASCAPSAAPKAPAVVVKALSVRYSDGFDRVTGVSIKGHLAEPDRQQAIQALRAREAERMPEDTIRDMLGRIRLMCAGQRQSQDDLTATIRTYTHALSQQPAYAVRKVLMAWPDSHQWWPAWVELSGAIDDACSKYRHTLRALESYIPGEKPARTKDTPERRSEAIRNVGEILGGLKSPWEMPARESTLGKVDREAWEERRRRQEEVKSMEDRAQGDAA